MLNPSQEDISRWKKDPITQAVFKAIRLEIEDATLGMAVGGTLNDTADSTSQETAWVVGRINGLQWILNYKVEEGKDNE